MRKRIISIEGPKEIVDKIVEFRKAETNLTISSVRHKLCNLKMKPSKKISEFF